MEKDCNSCGKTIYYSPFAFDQYGIPTGEYKHVTESGLCSNGIDGCWEKKTYKMERSEMSGYIEDDSTYVSLSASEVFSEVQAALDKAYPKQEEE